MKKVSFDFDNTLSRTCIQAMARVFIAEGYDVWIVTARQYASAGWIYHSNLDLYDVAEELGIPEEKIIFTNMEPKYLFFEDKDFAYHFDDLPIEIEEINNNTKTWAVLID